MTPPVDGLLELLREATDHEERERLLAELAQALGEDAPVSADTLLEVLREPDARIQRIGLEAHHGEVDPDLLGRLAELSHSDDWEVRQDLARALGRGPAGPLDGVVRRLCADSDYDVREAAVVAAGGRPDLREAVLERLADDRGAVAVAAARIIAADPTPAELPRLLQHTPEGEEEAAAYVGLVLPAIERASLELDALFEDVPAGALQRFAAGAPAGPSGDPLRALAEVRADPEALAPFGTLLTARAREGLLPRARGVDEEVDQLLELLRRDPPVPVVLLGPPGAGKTARVHELAHRLLTLPHWQMVAVEPTDLMAGLKYIGDMAARVEGLVAATRPPRRVVVYLPRAAELVWGGEDRASGIAGMLGPHIADGHLRVIGESPPEAWARALEAYPGMGAWFEPIQVTPATAVQTQAVLGAVRDAEAWPVPDAVLERIRELADDYLVGTAQPGGAVGLLRDVASRQPPDRDVVLRDVLEVLGQRTGIPVALLDDQSPLPAERAREMLATRVLGQPEAIAALVDLVMLIKAGLTDPGRPLGVLLFVGPTGVGKTELARALAALVFGDSERLVRLDMSEYATAHAFERLLDDRSPRSLTGVARQQPFSVILLDEIEKAHINVFDLCLQLFDAGRLTSAQGNVAEFRRTVVIMTSNVGAQSAPTSRVGFGGGPAAEAGERTRRELAAFFRPEFLGRIDRIVHFRPLSREVAEDLARKELGHLLERSGILRRGLRIDVDPRIYPLLVAEGYSSRFGARPLKRQVERVVLQPVARAICAGELPDQAMLCLRRRGSRVAVDIVALAGEASEEVEPAGLAPSQQELLDRLARLASRCEALAEPLEPLRERKRALLRRSSETGFWRDEARKRATFDQVHRAEQLLDQHRELTAAVEALQRRVAAEGVPEFRSERLGERLEQLTAEVDQIARVAQLTDPDARGDAVVWLRRVRRTGEGLSGLERLARMYLALAERRHWDGEVLAEHADAGQPCAYLGLGGLGAYGQLAGESGLHDLLGPGRGEGQRSREVVQVIVLPVGDDPPGLPRPDVSVDVQPARQATPRLLERADWEVRLAHEPSQTSLRGWVGGRKADAAQRFSPVLAAVQRSTDLDRILALPIVRRYELGATPRIKDLRTGRQTSQVDQVLRGYLDALLLTAGEEAR